MLGYDWLRKELLDMVKKNVIDKAPNTNNYNAYSLKELDGCTISGNYFFKDNQ